MMASKVEFHNDFSEVATKIQSILNGPLRKEQIYVVNGGDLGMEQKSSFKDRIKMSKARIDAESPTENNVNKGFKLK